MTVANGAAGVEENTIDESFGVLSFRFSLVVVSLYGACPGAHVCSISEMGNAVRRGGVIKLPSQLANSSPVKCLFLGAGRVLAMRKLYSVVYCLYWRVACVVRGEKNLYPIRVSSYFNYQPFSFTV